MANVTNQTQINLKLIMNTRAYTSVYVLWYEFIVYLKLIKTIMSLDLLLYFGIPLYNNT